MPLLGLLAVYGVVHLLALFVLRSSGVYSELFGFDSVILVDDDRLRGEPGDWIENHEFWDLPDEAPANEFWDDTEEQEPPAAEHLRAV